MIDEKHIIEIKKLNRKSFIYSLFPYVLFILFFSISYYLELEYSDATNLFNDKLIDVCSIFFGIFVGCLYLFGKFKTEKTYSEFLKFCKILLYLNIIVIILSFIIILINDKLPITISSKYFSIKMKSVLFSFYIGIFAVTLYYIIRFINIILKLLTLEKKDCR